MSARITRRMRRVEAVAAIIGQTHGFVVAPGHDEGPMPLHAMSKVKRVGDRVIPANPRAYSFIKAAEQVVDALSSKELR